MRDCTEYSSAMQQANSTRQAMYPAENASIPRQTPPWSVHIASFSWARVLVSIFLVWHHNGYSGRKGNFIGRLRYLTLNIILWRESQHQGIHTRERSEMVGKIFEKCRTTSILWGWLGLARHKHSNEGKTNASLNVRAHEWVSHSTFVQSSRWMARLDLDRIRAGERLPFLEVMARLLPKRRTT